MVDYLRLDIGERSPSVVTVIVEIPKGSTNKYEYDKKRNIFKRDRSLFSPVHYPTDYGFVPETLAEDGDPLDILVFGPAPTFSGCVYEAVPIGLIQMIDQGLADEKILAIPAEDPRFLGISEYTEVQPHLLRDRAVLLCIQVPRG